MASGFGINAKLVGSLKPNPVTGQLTAYFREPATGPFRRLRLHLFASDRGLMATPTHCTIYTTRAELYPWNSTLAEQESSQIFGLTSGPHGAECPGEVRPFHPTLEAGMSNPSPAAISSFSLKLNREDGDQYLGKLNFTMPPGLTANLHGVTYCPEADIASAAITAGKTEQADASCPASSQIGTSNVAAGPGSHPFHAEGKIYMAGPFQGAPLSLVAITPALAGPYDYGTVVVRVALHIDPLDAHVIADSETVPEIIGGIPIRHARNPGQHQQAKIHDQPDQLLRISHRLRRGRRPGHAGQFQLALPSPSTAPTLPFSPKMSITQLGGHKATLRSKDPSLAIELNTRPGRRQHQIGRRHPAESLRDRPAPPRQHLRPYQNSPPISAPVARRSVKRLPPRHFLKSRSRARSTRYRASESCPTWPSSSAVR